MPRLPGMVAAIFLLSVSVQARNLAYVKFNGTTYEQSLEYVRLLSDRGYQPVHIFAPNEVILNSFNIPGKALLSANLPFAVVITSDTTARFFPDEPDRGELAYQHLVSYWRANQASGLLPLHRPAIPDSAFLSSLDTTTLKILGSLAPAVSFEQQLTGQYLIGSTAVGIYLMESLLGTEDWTPDAERMVQNEIVQGLDWLSSAAEEREVKVTWV